MRSGIATCQDNLLAKSRVGPLSAMERRALDAHVGVCELCRAAVAFGALFDSIPDYPAAEDDVLVRRLADRGAQGRRAAGVRRPSRLLALAAGVALFVVAGAAVAWVSTRRPSQTPTSSPSVMSPLSRRAARAARGSGAVSVGVAEPVAPALPARALHDQEPALRAAAPPRGRTRFDLAGSTPATSPPATAADLFARANSTRRLRSFREAILQYQALQKLFPGSSEAQVSLVSTGDLLSREGETENALASFDRYLGEGGPAPLAPEALFGRARCLERLSRRAEELATWRELLRRFPGSIYEALALRRVDELAR